MRLVLAVVGRPRHAAIAAAIQDYETRAARFWPLDVHEVREENARGLKPAQVQEREGERLAERVGNARLVACDVRGTAFSSEQFATWLQEERERAIDVAFLIGGAYGLPQKMLTASAVRLSLANWTLPHELARLVLAEQLFRAGSILRGEPYHK